MHLPGPLRAAVGLIAAAADEARHLPDRAIELPMLAVSSALQASLRAQQRYARLAARGDEILNRRPDTDEPPPWATFDEPASTDDLRKAALAQLDSLADGPTTSRLFEELFGVGDPDPSEDEDEEADSTNAPSRGKSVSKPRHVAPSKFDDAGDD